MRSRAVMISEAVAQRPRSVARMEQGRSLFARIWGHRRWVGL